MMPEQKTRQFQLPPEIPPVLANKIRNEIELWQVAHHVIPTIGVSDQILLLRYFEGGNLGKAVPTLKNKRLYRA